MPKSIFIDFSKKDIDEITKKITNILKSGVSNSLIFETYQGQNREKNECFRNKYCLTDINKVKNLIVENLKSSDISDVQLDERPEILRKNNYMYIYLMTVSLSEDSENYNDTDVYLKVELLKIKGNKTIILLISLHEPEKPMTRNYERLK